MHEDDMVDGILGEQHYQAVFTASSSMPPVINADVAHASLSTWSSDVEANFKALAWRADRIHLPLGHNDQLALLIDDICESSYTSSILLSNQFARWFNKST